MVAAAGAELVRLGLLRTGRVRFRARGLSMRPFLRDGDVVSVVRADPDHLGVGDVVCYESEPGRVALHRVVDRDADHLVAKGDALAWVERVPPERVLGRLAAVERRRGLERLATRLAGLTQRLGWPQRILGHA